MKKLILLIFVVAASLNAQRVQGQIGQVPVVAAADNSPVGGAGNLTTVGSVPYVSASGILNQDAGQFAWDATNNRLQIGPTAPTNALAVSSSTYYESTILIQSSLASDIFGLRINSTAGGGKDWRLEQGRAAAGALAFYQATSGATPLTILSGGNVGIGTTTPATTLQVAGGKILLDNAQAIQFKDSLGTARTILQVDSGDNVYLDSAATGGDMFFRARGVDKMTIKGTSGNVGIGTTTPVYGLDVAKSGASGTARFYDQTATTGSTLAVFRAGVAQSGNVLEVQNNAGTVIASVGSTGNLYSANALSVGATFSVVTLYSPSDGVLRLTDNAGTSFNRLQFGGTTSSFPSIQRSTTKLFFRLADDSAGATVRAGGYESSDGTAGATVTTCTGFKNGLCISGT